MNNISIFAERLIELMQDTNSTQMRIAKIAGCGHGSVSRWINAMNYPTGLNLIRLSAYFNCSIDFLIGKADIPDIENTELISSFKERLKFLANEKRKTLHGVAVDLDLDDSILYRWGKGKYLPNTLGLIMLADYFSCSVDYLIGRKD